MADLVFNIAKGRAAELYNRVKGGDPSAARLKVMVFSGSVTDANLKDVDTVAAAVSAGLTALTTNGWAIKTIAAADIAAMAPDDTNDWMALDIPDQTWTAVSSGTSTRLIVAYTPDGTDTTANMVPLTAHDFAVTPDGSDVTAVINTAGFYKAS